MHSIKPHLDNPYIRGSGFAYTRFGLMCLQSASDCNFPFYDGLQRLDLAVSDYIRGQRTRHHVTQKTKLRQARGSVLPSS